MLHGPVNKLVFGCLKLKENSDCLELEVQIMVCDWFYVNQVVGDLLEIFSYMLAAVKESGFQLDYYYYYHYDYHHHHHHPFAIT